MTITTYYSILHSVLSSIPNLLNFTDFLKNFYITVCYNIQTVNGSPSNQFKTKFVILQYSVAGSQKPYIFLQYLDGGYPGSIGTGGEGRRPGLMNRRLAPGLLQRIAPPVLMNRRRVCSWSFVPGLFLFLVYSWFIPGLFRRVCSVPGLVCSWSFRVCSLLHEPERRRGGTMNDARAASRSIESPAVVRQSESAPAELMKGENRRHSALIPENVFCSF